MAGDVDLQQKVEFLEDPDSYQDSPIAVQSIETHMAWVFLTDHFAYKLKKPVRLSFLDFSTVELRHEDCILEVELNRRLAKDVYLGILPLRKTLDGALCLGGDGRVVDWLVHMRRLPTEQMLDDRLRHGSVSGEETDRVGELLSEFYLSRAPIRMSPLVYRRRFRRYVTENHDALTSSKYNLPLRQIKTLTSKQHAFLDDHPELFDARVRGRHIVEGHGDLRPDHICLSRPPVIFDCLEFNRSFRVQDAADELSFLAMECERLGSPWVGQSIFDSYSERTGDYPPRDVIYFYKAFRACLRAKLAIWHLDDGIEADLWTDRSNAYLNLAEKYLSGSPAFTATSVGGDERTAVE